MRVSCSSFPILLRFFHPFPFPVVIDCHSSVPSDDSTSCERCSVMSCALPTDSQMLMLLLLFSARAASINDTLIDVHAAISSLKTGDGGVRHHHPSAKNHMNFFPSPYVCFTWRVVCVHVVCLLSSFYFLLCDTTTHRYKQQMACAR